MQPFFSHALAPLALALALSLAAPTHLAHAAVFDAADTLPPGAAALGGFTEIMIADPTSEGLEARGRYGLNEDWNLGANLGTGSKSKRFRMGLEAVFNLLPDWAGQLGLSFLGSSTYLRRDTGGGVQFRVGPMLHKRFNGFTGYPANAYLALPWYVDVRGSTLTTGSQVVLGSNFDIARDGRYYLDAELGLRLAKADSYVVFGMGMRIGELSFTGNSERREQQKKRPSPPREKEWTDEDFDQP